MVFIIDHSFLKRMNSLNIVIVWILLLLPMHINCILLGPDNKMSRMKKIISESDNEDEFYTRKLKKGL